MSWSTNLASLLAAHPASSWDYTITGGHAVVVVTVRDEWHHVGHMVHGSSPIPADAEDFEISLAMSRALGNAIDKHFTQIEQLEAA